MVMRQSAVVSLTSDHFEAWQRSTNKAAMLNLWARGEHSLPLVPHSASPEYRELRDVSPTPWGRLLIGSVTQALAVTNQYRVGDEVGPDGEVAASTKTFEQVWKPNGMLSKQGSLYRAALGQNQAYIVTLPGRRPHTDLPTARMFGMPATKMAAFYDAEGEDEFARFAIWGEVQNPRGGDPYLTMRVYDEEAVYFLECKLDGSDMTFVSYEPHDVGVTPVHRLSPQIDLEGRTTGEVEPFIPLLRRLDQDTFDRLVVQRFNSWKVRYIAGMAKPGTEEEKQAAARMLKVADLLISDQSDTKFGTLDGSDIEPYIKAHDADVQDLAAVSQTPPHHLLGQIANLSADALAAAEASLMRKVGEYQLSFAQTWDQALRSCAFILAKDYGQEYIDEALDYSTEIRWREAEQRSLSQAADALGKVADQLEVPVDMLWEQLPFWKKEDTDRAKAIIEQRSGDALLMQFLDEAAGSGNNPIATPEA